MDPVWAEHHTGLGLVYESVFTLIYLCMIWFGMLKIFHTGLYGVAGKFV